MNYFGFRPINAFFDQESMHAYKPGGFHPVCLEDTFENGRYIIRHKLGWGGFATVWLARDTMFVYNLTHSFPLNSKYR